MNLPDRHLLMGMGFGALCLTALASAVPALADEIAAGFNTDNLVKFDDRLFTVDYEDWVSTDPISTHSVKKIEGGSVSYVTVTRTATGTYSTDGLMSRHVQYPGISVKEVSSPMAYWRDGGWWTFQPVSTGSFFYLTDQGTAIARWNGTTCVAAENFLVC